jgi:RNA polymerase sigma factor (sigma-70 family)
MDKYTRLTNLHYEWVAIARKFGAMDLAEDIVQETYIKIIRLNYIDKIVGEKKINKSYMWLTIHSVYIDHWRAYGIKHVSLDDVPQIVYNELNEAEQEATSNIEQMIEDEIESWHWYDSMLFRLYKDSNLSMRQIADKTNISLTSIFHTLKKCKDRLKENVGEDYEDFINKDFELI